MIQWDPMTRREFAIMQAVFSRLARHRGNMPDLAYVVRDESSVTHVAMLYQEPGKWERWGLQLRPPRDITESWTTILEWMRPLIGDRAFFEVYPREADVVSTAPTRWFWVFPDSQPSECNLKVEGT